MTIGDFRSPDLSYKGWLESVKESAEVKIDSPVNNQSFFTDLGKSKKEIIERIKRSYLSSDQGLMSWK